MFRGVQSPQGEIPKNAMGKVNKKELVRLFDAGEAEL